jgi:hypothetical protein
MKKIMILALLCGLTQFCIAQISNKELENEFIKRKESFYFVIVKPNEEEKIVSDLLVGASESEQKILSKDEMRKRYPNLKTDFIIITKIKEGLQLMNLDELLNKYKVNKQYRNFNIAVDGLVVANRETLLASPSYVVNVIVNKEKRFINIITKFHDKFIESRRGAKQDSLERIRLIQQRKNEKPMMPPNKP